MSIGRAGRSTRQLAERRRRANLLMLITGLSATLVLLILILLSKPLGVGSGGVLALLLAVWLIKQLVEAESKQVDRMERRALRGAKAEELVGSILDDLGEDFLALHDIPSPYGNIDHVVISRRSGVFLIETKAHGGRVSTVNGQLLINGHQPEKDFIAQAVRNTYWLRDQIQKATNIRPWIIPIIVFTNAFVEPGPPIKNVLIVNKKYLPRVLCRPIAKAQNSVLWNNRKQIQEALYTAQEPIPSRAAR
ncbi:MAG: nuclease-related domain-containing protein [Aggregatilineaceae bacterium]